MINFGEVPAGAVLPIPFAAYAAATGASVTLTGLATTDIEVYKGTSMTQRSSDAGYTLMDTDGIDLDGITGIHGFSIDTGDNTDASFYAVGSYFTVVVSAVTIDGQTVNFIAATFRLKAAESVAGYPKADVSHLLGTAWLTPGTAGTPDVNVKLWNALTTVALPLAPTTAGRTLDVSATGEAGLDWANIGSPTTVVNLSGTTVKTATDVETDTADIQSRLPAALVSGRMDASVGAMAANVMTAAAADPDLTTELQSGLATAANLATVAGYIDTEIAAIKAVTDALPNAGALTTIQSDLDDIQTRLPAALVSGRIDASVGAMAANVVTATAIADAAIDRATFAADTGLQSVRSNTAQAGASTSITLDASASATTDFYINHLVLLTGGTGVGQARYITAYNGTTKVATVSAWATNPDNTSTFALLAGDAIPGATAPSAATIADAVWDEILSGHAVSGSTGEALSAAGGAGDPWITPLPGSYSAGQAGKIVGDYLNASVSSRATQTSVDTIDGIVDAILVDTAEIGAAGAGLTALASASNLATVAGYLDTEIAAILADTNELQTDWANGGRLDLILDARASQTSVDDLPTNAELATALGTSDDATLAAIAALSIPTATQNADALLNRDMSAVSDTNSRSPLNALRFIRNKWDVAATTLTVKKEDDSTTAWTATVSTSAGADPIVGNDPA